MESTQQTLRVAGLPPKTEQNDVKEFFTERIKRNHGRQIVESVGPICSHASRVTKRTTVSFSSQKTAQKAIDLEEPYRRLSAENGGAETITLDASFLDLTTLHSSDNPATGKPDIDIVALHGLTGHAWNSFTTSRLVDTNAGRTKETNWLRDILPGLLEQDKRQNIYPRVMTYGYNADIWMTQSVADIAVPVKNLLSYLDTERSEDPSRPLFFVGHSLGGIVIKQAIVALADEAITRSLQEPQGSTRQYNFPVKGCMFFGVPNRGADFAGTASSILTLLNTVFNVNKNVVHDLESKSQQLANIASQFRQIRKDHDIPVISFYETVKYSSLGLIVNKDSAVIEYPGSPRAFGVDRNHKEMAKFSDADTHALEPAIHFLAQFARDALNARRARRHSLSRLPAPAMIGGSGSAEDKFSILESYDTVFLVDDSPSMAGEHWDLVKSILDYATVVATAYDPDGIDVHFLNNKTANRDGIRDQTVAAEIHQNIVLRGNTPILDQLSRHLNNYIRKFEQANELNFNGYNLIILTDGEPNPAWEEPDDISDREDAKIHSAAYRLIRKTIVRTAKRLNEAGAERNQVGIQFCQIGNDEGAQNFFKYLDDKLKGKFKLDRDMVDTIRCESEVDLTPSFFKKLLLGGVDKGEDHEEPNIGRKYVAEGIPPGLAQHNYSLAHEPIPSRKGKERHPIAEDLQAKSSRREQSQSDPETATLQSLQDAQGSTYYPRASNPRFLQSSLEYQHQDQDPPVPPEREYPKRQRQSTLPSDPTELPIRDSGRSSTFGNKKENKKGWWPLS